MPKLSVTIIAKNEAHRIAATIASVGGLADEVLVVDSGSTDGTQALAEQFGCKVIFNAWEGYGPQKRFAEDAAKHDWLLNLDADEVLTDQAIAEIKAVLADDEPDCHGYRIRTVNVYPGQDQPRLFADYHNYIRLYDRRIMRFPASLVHDAIVPNAAMRIGQIKGTCLHYSIDSLDHLRTKLDSYTTLQAKELKKPQSYIFARLPFEYSIHFLKNYFMRRHITGGFYGLKFAHEVARSKHSRLLKLLGQARDQTAR